MRQPGDGFLSCRAKSPAAAGSLFLVLRVRDSSTSVGMTGKLRVRTRAATFHPNVCASNLPKENFEELNALPFAGNVGVERGAFHRCAVSGWCGRIEHLERVAAAKSSRNHSLDVGALQEGRRCGHCSDRFLWPDRRPETLCKTARHQRSQDRNDQCFHNFFLSARRANSCP
jgi:hypothetical protein